MSLCLSDRFFRLGMLYDDVKRCLQPYGDGLSAWYHFLWKKIEVEANGLAFYYSRGLDGRRCRQCPNRKRIEGELQSQKELVEEPLKAEIETLRDIVERLTNEARFAAQRHEDTLSNFRDRNAELVRELETANLAIQGFEDANVSSGFTINFT